MLITTPCVVSLTWTLAGAQGEAIDTLTEPLEFYFGGDDLLPKLEEAIAGQAAGFRTDLHLEPEHAFGEYDSGLVCFEDRNLFPDGISVGMQFDGMPECAATVGMPSDVIYAITEIYPEHVVLDGNHPLAGIALRLAVTVCAVREATAQEREDGALSDSPVQVLSPTPASNRLH